MAELTPDQRALLETIAGPESAGNYGVMYGGGTFDDFSDHPRQPIMIASGPNKGKYSTAAGKYQFLKGTWDEQASELGLHDFSPESQDLAAWHLAKTEYQRDTGRDLDVDLAAGDLSRVAPSLRDQWTSMPGGIEQGINGNAFANAYAGNLGQPAPSSAQNAISRATRPKAGLFAALGGGFNSAINAMQHQAQPLMRSAQSTVQGAAPAIMRAALGTVPGRTALIDGALKQVFAGQRSSPLDGNSIMTANNGQQTVGQRVNGSDRGYTVSGSDWFNEARGL